MKHLGILIKEIHSTNKILYKHYQIFTEIPMSQGQLLPKGKISGGGKNSQSKKAERRKLKLKDKKNL